MARCVACAMETQQFIAVFRQRDDSGLRDLGLATIIWIADYECI